jgi:hypothetical protein
LNINGYTIHFKQGLKQINQNVAPISGMRLNNLIETIRGYCQLFLTELSDGAKQKKKKIKDHPLVSLETSYTLNMLYVNAQKPWRVKPIGLH